MKGKSLLKKASKTIANKVTESGSIDELVNDTITKISEKTGRKTASDYMKMKKEKNYLIVKESSFSSSDVASLITGKKESLWGEFYDEMKKELKDELNGVEHSEENEEQLDDSFKYVICSESGEIEYTVIDESRYNAVFNKPHLIIKDFSNNVEIGIIHQNYMPIPMLRDDDYHIFPKMEEDVKECTIELGGKELGEVRTFTLRDKQGYDFFDSYSINILEKKQYEICYKNKKIAHVYPLPFQLGSGYKETKLIGYNNVKDELVVMMIALAINLIS